MSAPRLRRSTRSNSSSNNSLNNGHRYAGKKRRTIDVSSDCSDDGSSSSYESDNNTNNNTNNNNNNADNANVNKRRRLNYVLDKNKWREMNKKSSHQRRSTRIAYRELADDTVAHRAQIVDPMSGVFMDKLVLQNGIFEGVCHPNEAFMDIEQAKHMTNILKEQTRRLANEQFTISPSDYIASIQKEFGDGTGDGTGDIAWNDIGDRLALWYLSTAPIEFMNGALQQCGANDDINIKKKPRQVRQKKKFTTDQPLIEPKKVRKQSNKEKTETKSRVTHLKKILRRKCESQDGVNPFEFLINPQSYSQTIENLFDLSFIMNQGFAQMDVSQDTEQPVLSYVSTSERQQRHNASNNTNSNGQCIIKFNPNTFCNLINVYKINDSQIERADAAADSDADADA